MGITESANIRDATATNMIQNAVDHLGRVLGTPVTPDLFPVVLFSTWSQNPTEHSETRLTVRAGIVRPILSTSMHKLVAGGASYRADREREPP
jgi:hypothetical protein